MLASFRGKCDRLVVMLKNMYMQINRKTALNSAAAILLNYLLPFHSVAADSLPSSAAWPSEKSGDILTSAN